MDNQTLQKLKEAIARSNNIGVVVGRNPSVDQMAAALALYLLLQRANKKVSIASPSEPIVELSSLVGINRVQNNLGGEANDLVVSFPYVDGEIEKVSYTLEEGFLNIIVKASEQGLSFDEKDVRYMRGSGTVDLLMVVGTQNVSDLEGVIEPDKLRNVRIINIDNNSRNQGFGDIVLVAPKLTSVSELVTDMALALGFHIDEDTAQNLMSGIMYATKNFQGETSPLAFEMAAFLMKKGASRSRSDRREDRFDARDQEELPQPRNQQQQPRPQQQQQARNRNDQPRRQDQPDDRAGDPFASAQRGHQNNDQGYDQRAAGDDTNADAAPADDEDAPNDWLSPKVYKGSTNVE